MSSKRKTLSDDDRHLWKKVTETIRPIEGRSKRLSEDVSMATLIESPSMGTTRPPAPLKPSGTSARSDIPAFLDPFQPVSSKPKPVLSQAPIDRKTKRKIAKGSVPLGARLDMHGMTQEVAHSALIGFVRRTRQEGHRHVLVITGKGTSQGGNGVLRYAVPRWLTTAPLAQFVSGFEWASQGHGGGGALYIRLRRLEGRRS